MTGLRLSADRAAVMCLAGALGLLVALHVRSPRSFESPLSAFSIGPTSTLYALALSFAGVGLILASFSTRSGLARVAVILAGGGALLASWTPTDGLTMAELQDKVHLLGMLLFLGAGGVALVVSRPRAGMSWATLATVAACIIFKVVHSPALGWVQRAAVALLLVAHLLATNAQAKSYGRRSGVPGGA